MYPMHVWTAVKDLPPQPAFRPPSILPCPLPPPSVVHGPHGYTPHLPVLLLGFTCHPRNRCHQIRTKI